MKKRKILINSILSTLLLTATLSAQSMTCKDGKCFIDISKLSPSRSAESKVSTFKNLKNPYFSTRVQENIVYDSINTPSTIILDHSKYVMSDIEKEEYYINERIKEAELEKELIVPIITFEDNIEEEIILAHSELYCDDNKQVTFHPDKNYYECA